jgi:CBS domain-containing protein
MSQLQREMLEIVRRRRPITLPETTSVQDACRMMRDHRIGAILVTGEQAALVGVFTGRDAVTRVLANGKDAATTTLSAVMTPEPDTIGSHATAIEALRMMQDGGYRHLAVVDGGRVNGIASIGDFSGLEIARLDAETGFWEIL